MVTMVRRLVESAVCALVLSIGLPVGASGVAHADAASPTVSGPVTGGGGNPFPLGGHAEYDLASVGYVQEEFFVEGTAEAYAPTEPLTSDGRWVVEPSSQAPYKTRVVVDRPIDARDFNGTVVVEWFNVSGGADGAPAWLHMHAELIRRGYAWVGVSAQEVGLTTGPLATKTLDPVRYASVSHPGDSYSYDMFSQAGQAIRDNADLILGGLRPERLIPVGESQSASRLRTYINAVHPLVEVYDGFLPSVSGGGSSAALSQTPLPTVPAPSPTLIRDDLGVPVLFLQSETDARGAILSGSRQADGPLFRQWEVAGSAHFDQYGLMTSMTDVGARASFAEWFNSMQHPTNQPNPRFTCNSPVNTGPRTFVMRAAIAALDRWIADGTPAPVAPRLQTASLDPFEYALDANGNVLGGIRTPAVDAPVATLSGLGQSGVQFCGSFGTTMPFAPEQLAALYRTHGRFVSAWNQATQDAVKAGFLLPEDARHLRAVVAQSDILR
jgi:hypothetical protein